MGKTQMNQTLTCELCGFQAEANILTGVGEGEQLFAFTYTPFETCTCHDREACNKRLEKQQEYDMQKIKEKEIGQYVDLINSLKIELAMVKYENQRLRDQIEQAVRALGGSK